MSGYKLISAYAGALFDIFMESKVGEWVRETSLGLAVFAGVVFVVAKVSALLIFCLFGWCA